MSESTPVVHQFCEDKKYIKKNICNTPELSSDGNGEYQIMGLAEYIHYYETVDLGNEYGNEFRRVPFMKEIVGGVEHLVLFRADFAYFYDYDIFDFYHNYEKRINEYAESPDNKYKIDGYDIPIISYTDPANRITDISKMNYGTLNKWGNQPSIGINVGTNSQEMSQYLSKKINSDHECVIIKFYIPINNDIKVCLIPRGCSWNHVTCDYIANTTYDLIGHLVHNEYDSLKKENKLEELMKVGHWDEYTMHKLFNKNELIYELNILDNGRHKITQYITHKTKFIGGEFGYTANPEKKVILKSSVAVMTGGYYKKYMKYKTKCKEIMLICK